MLTPRISTSAVLVGMLILTVGSKAIAECDPRDILSQDSKQLYWTEQTQRLFLLSATSEQYNNVRNTWQSGGSYGPYSGYLNFEEAKAAARREAKYLSIAEDGSLDVKYLSQTLNPDAVSAFVACLKLQKESPGIRIWLSGRGDDRFELQAFWIGTDAAQGSANLVEAKISQGAELINVPEIWTKGNVQSVWLRKPAESTVDITLKIGTLSQTFVLQKELPKIEFANQETFGDFVELESCHYRRSDSTARPTHKDGYLIPSMTRAEVAVSIGYNTQSPTIIQNDFLSATIAFATETTTCANLAHIRGRTRAVERFPVPPGSNIKNVLAK